MRPTTFQFRASQNQFEDGNLSPSISGTILQFQAGASLNVGDAVQISGTNIVIKATTTLYRIIGVVIGGDSMPDKGIFESTGSAATDETLVLAGMLAATNGQKVYVLVQGIFYIVSDGAIANGGTIVPSSSTAGRVSAGSNQFTIAAGATAVTSSSANGAIVVGNDSITPVIGKLVDAATTGAAQARLAYINIH